MESAASPAPLAAQDPKTAQFTPEMQERQRKKQGIQLARKRILQQLEASGSERYTEMLRNSLAELDAELSKLDS